MAPERGLVLPSAPSAANANAAAVTDNGDAAAQVNRSRADSCKYKEN